MIINCINDQKLPVYGNGLNIRDWINVHDHCSAIYMILKNGSNGETYNIGGNSEFKNIDIINSICSTLDSILPSKNRSSYKELISYVEDRPGHDFRYAIDCQKIHTELDWEPKESFLNGLEKPFYGTWTMKNGGEKLQKKNHKQERLGLKKKS